ncbi:MAG: hypothetical protein NTX03_01655 [Bacteroidetes bacterium]|nr:hypothetical protein [Bacteroidota bacterium]
MSNLWSYSSNVFDNISKNNFKLLYDVALGHDTYLAGLKDTDPEILVLYNLEHPSYVDYVTKYDLWFGDYNAKEAAVQSFQMEIEHLGGDKIASYDVQIQIVYPKGSPGYTHLLANGRAPFQKGSYSSRLSALNGLINNIGDDVALADLKVEIVAFAAIVNNAFIAKNAAIVQLKSERDVLEAARISHCTVMFQILASLMIKYLLHLTEIEKFYNMGLIRTKGAAHPKITHTIAKGATFNWSINFTEETVIRVKNLLDVPIHVERMNSSTEPATAGNIIPPGDTQDIALSTIGVGAFLNFTNQDILNKAKFHAEVL